MIRKTLAIILSAVFLVSMAAAMTGTVGGDMGYYKVDAGISGAAVTFGNDYKGVTGVDGTLKVEVYTTGTPYTTYKVEKQGYDTYTGKITDYPAKDQIVDLSATLEPQMIGGDMGYYDISTNVPDAKVFFDDDFKITTSWDGSAMVGVYTTGTPYTTYKVEKAGYETYTAKITDYPAAGEIVQISAHLEQQMIGGDKGYYKITTNGVAGADIYFDNDHKGITGEDGTATIEVYTTGTPYTTYKVEKAGYTTYTAKITEYPAAGEIVQISANIVMVPVTEMPTEPTQSPFPVAGIFGLAALGAFALSRKE